MTEPNPARPARLWAALLAATFFLAASAGLMVLSQAREIVAANPAGRGWR